MEKANATQALDIRADAGSDRQAGSNYRICNFLPTKAATPLQRRFSLGSFRKAEIERRANCEEKCQRKNNTESAKQTDRFE